ncbi:hypothetical protein [Halalkalicoccus sp. NIPERK01]|uniref:hypothetical protein n=1 Tax=Halalkalicoccus sp. NIPERK01 TaxID=3053469 RepID=UPI00256EB2CD|nr:hypothetical protein [Halalkalicoccus sp. NIPERK01]
MSHSRSLPRPALESAGPVLALVGFALALGALVYRTPIRGPLYRPTVLPSRLPLEVAGADPLVVLASVGIGQSWLYLTGLSAALLVAGVLLAAVGSRLGTAFGTLLAGGAAGTLVRVSGCHCGAGSTTYLWELLV